MENEKKPDMITEDCPDDLSSWKAPTTFPAPPDGKLDHVPSGGVK